MLNRKQRPLPRQPVKRKNKRVLTKLAIAFALALLGLGIYTVAYKYTEAAKTRNLLESTQQQLIETTQQLEEHQTESKEQYEQKQLELEELNKRLQETEKALQAKRSAPKAVAATKPAYTPTGDKNAWLAASGIPASDWWAVDYLVSRESGWKPCAYNPGRNDCNAKPTTACGLVQALPCSKLGPNWNDPVHALKWQYNYVKVRYGGYPQAVAFWKANSWY